MSELLTPTFILILLFSTIRSATPLLFAALGGMFSERSGVINIALEGLMLAGAFTAAVVTYELSNPYVGFIAGMAVGALVAFIFAIAVIKFEADQVVTGFAISLLMLGLPAGPRPRPLLEWNDFEGDPENLRDLLFEPTLFCELVATSAQAATDDLLAEKL